MSSLKERKETAELADPKAIKMVPVQCQAVPEVEAVSCQRLRRAPAVQLNDASCGAVPRRSQDDSGGSSPETDPVSNKNRTLLCRT
uniref:Uncharacterized protein n=1 Tax=Sphaerodactylus townsendi TaxID=933632 RepID=A0ACB8FQB1_9SAUR